MMPKEHIKRLCLIPLCKNERFDLVHKFPMDNQRAEEWRRAINIPEINCLPLDMLRKRTICSKHFRKEDYKNVESRSLNKTAIPSLNFREMENGTEKTNSNETVKGQSSMVGVANDADRSEVYLMQNGRDPVEPMEGNRLETVPRKNVERKHLLKLVCDADSAKTLFSDTAPSSKRRVVVSNRGPSINIRCNDSELSLIPSTKLIDGEYVNVTILPVVNVNEDPITLIDQSDQIDFMSTKTTSLNYIQDADLFASEVIFDPCANEIVEPLESSYLTMAEDSITIRSSNHPDPFTVNNFWLRDHCCCSECYNHDTKQRKIGLLDIPIDIKPSQYSIDGNELQITWPDNHQSSYDIADLSANTFDKYQTSLLVNDKKTLWNAKSIKSMAYARVSFPDYLCDENVAKTFVSSLVHYGIAFIENVPPNMLTTELAIKRLFNVQKTFFGEMWSFNDDKAHNDNAYTKEFLAAHTDNTYFNDAAGIQALHCLIHTGHGGETLLVDGFNVLNELKISNESLFNRLCTTNVESEYIEDGRHHTYTAPLVKLNSLTQQPEQIRFNSYDRAPMRSIPMSEMSTFYSDMQTFVRRIQSPDNEWWFKLEPGTVVFFDNWRILHGRSSYTGYRKMGGGYVARTEFMSVARTMNLIS